MATYSVQFRLLCLVLLASQSFALDFWNDLRVTWDWSPSESAFVRMPKNIFDATADGWVQSSTTCGNQGSFNGFQWLHPGDDGVALLFDANGHVAGIQSMVPHHELLRPENTYRFERMPMYQNQTLNGIEYFVITVYFITPDLICRVSDADSPPSNIGKLSQVYFQNGPSPNYLRHAPEQRDSAIDLGWTRNNCVPGMGWHNFFEVERYEQHACNEVPPTCILYDEFDQMHGFCLTFPGMGSSNRFEHPTSPAVNATLGNAPQCILDQTDRIGATTIHVYFTNTPWNFGC